ncbi:MAG: hypothetical protein R2771_14105 [Saprospiraceae bacterium]
MKTLRIFLTLIFGIGIMVAVNAQRPYDYRYDDGKTYKERKLEKNYKYDRNSTEDLKYLIDKADRRGELTPRELRILHDEYNELITLENRIYSNDRVTSWERARLESEKDDLYELIKRYSNNRYRY